MVEPLAAGDLRIDPSQKDGSPVLELVWSGKGTERSPGATITPWLTSCLAHAKDRSSSVRMNVSSVDHMNSATITTIVQIIRESRARDVKLTLVYDGKKSWQELSFGALSMFVKDDGLFALEKG